ncbi:MAG TPA: UpxY family transcription antiterminator [Bryobacteraceae bacterium]|nr:UpxY family transcription antiterminator [Bryobacteraceae bacterium]
MQRAWYAVRVRSNHEQASADFLKNVGHEVFHPTYRDLRQWSDRVKEINAPLFNGYIFCRMDISRRLPVMQAPGVVSIVSFGKTFLAVPEEEIAAVEQIVKSPLFARPCPYLNVGERVRVERGPLAGVEGILLERAGDNRLIVSVHLLQRSIATEVDLEWVRPVGRSGFGAVVPPNDAQGLQAHSARAGRL